jgi:predicted Zn-dependent peptidase
MLQSLDQTFVHRQLDCGVELAVDPLPERQTVAIYLRILAGTADEPEEHNGVAALVESVLPKGTKKYTGPQLADAFDKLGVKWGGSAGRQSTLFRALCLPEFTLDVIDLFAELLIRPTFPEEACRVAVDLARQELKSLDDDPDTLLRRDMQRLVYGPRYGRWGGGSFESLERIDRDAMLAFYQSAYAAGRVQLVAAGPVDADKLASTIEKRFAGFGSAKRAGREPAQWTFTPGKVHQEKTLEQQYIGLALPGASRADVNFATEQVLIGVLAGGMSGRLFTEVREKQGLVYWVGAWHEQPRGAGVIFLGASTTPQRCQKTYKTLLRELERVSEDLAEAEVKRARDSLVAHAMTEDDLTRARGAGLSDDLFHFGRPIGPTAKIEAVKRVTLDDVVQYARNLRRDELCIASLGSAKL